jgi:hypothetical protein
MTKKLNVEGITNELDGSVFFQRRQDPVPPVRVVPPVPQVRAVPPTPSTKRVMKQRHPFDIYQDQYESLCDLALEERKQGGVGSMSALVREAIDKIIAERRRK